MHDQQGRQYVTKTLTFTGKALRIALACGASVAVLGFSGAAYAQDDDDDEEDAIIVTGSRLVIPSGMESAVPVTSMDVEEINNMSPTTLIAAMNTLPIFVNNESPNANSGFFARGGTGNLNLRGLGQNRTLTLLDGRRVAPSTAFGGADINLIPTAMLRGVENVTGGASAAYGTDAVAGVTNFLLNTNFTGIEVDVQGGITQRGDGENYEASVAYGTPIGDRGHFLLSAEVAQQYGIFNYQGRDWYNAWGTIDSNNDGIDEEWPDVRSARVSFDGIINSPNALLNNLQFDRNGNTHPYVLGSVYDGATAIGGSESRTTGGSGDDINCGEVCNVFPDTDRYSLFAYADYEVANNITVFAQYMRGRSHLHEYATPRGSMAGQPQGLVTIFADNFYLPQNIKTIMQQNNIASFSFRRMCSIEDCGDLYYDETTTQNIGTAGFDAKIDNDGFLDGWQIKGYYQYSHSRKVWDQFGLRLDRLYAALDAVDDGTGKAVCRVTLFNSPDFPGCQPLNLFGRGRASAAAIDYVTGFEPGVQVTTPLYFPATGLTRGITDSYTTTEAKRNITTFEQHFAEVSFAGTVFDLPAGPVALAFGASFREDKIFQVSRHNDLNAVGNTQSGRPVLCSGASPGLRGVGASDCGGVVETQFSRVSNILESTDVKEVFAETLLPILDSDTGQSVSLNLAARWADYEGSGQIWSYKGSLDMSIFDGLRLRGTYSRDVRAANMDERFNLTGSAATLTDPRISTADTAACNAANPAPTTVNCSNSYNVTSFSGGNPDLAPEKADTFTVGVVVQPKFLQGFQMSVDWFRVDLQGAIGTVGINEVARRCVQDQEAQFCNLVTFDPTAKTPAGNYPLMLFVGNQNVNVAQSLVEGVDVEARYSTDVKIFGGDERISVRAFGTWLLERSNTGAPTAANNFAPVPVHFEGFGTFPKFRATGYVSYNNGPFNLNLTGRLTGKSLVQNIATQGAAGITLVDNEIPAVFYMDSRMNYDFKVAGADVQAYFAVTNLLDKDPPIIATYAAGFTQNASQTNTFLHDVLGRRFTLGAKFKL